MEFSNHEISDLISAKKEIEEQIQRATSLAYDTTIKEFLDHINKNNLDATVIMHGLRSALSNADRTWDQEKALSLLKKAKIQYRNPSNPSQTCGRVGPLPVWAQEGMKEAGLDPMSSKDRIQYKETMLEKVSDE